MKFLRDLLSQTPRRFLSEAAHREKLTRQLQMTPVTVEQLRNHGVGAERLLRLEYFFYTNAPSKADSLAQALRGQGYSPECCPSASDRRRTLVTGWSPPLLMSTDVVSAWTKEMCELGFTHDCEFDGWGTNPEQ